MSIHVISSLSSVVDAFTVSGFVPPEEFSLEGVVILTSQTRDEFLDRVLPDPRLPDQVRAELRRLVMAGNIAFADCIDNEDPYVHVREFVDEKITPLSTQQKEAFRYRHCEERLSPQRKMEAVLRTLGVQVTNFYHSPIDIACRPKVS